MRSNTLHNKAVQQIIKEFSRLLKTSVNWLMLGLSGRQWLASLVICLLLSPIFSLPVQATVLVSNTDTNANNFEPVNAPQPIWETAWTNLNARFDEWTTPMRAGNDLADNSISLKKAGTDKSVKDELLPKKDETLNSEKKIDEKAAKLEEGSSEPSLKNNASAVLRKTRRAMPVQVPQRPVLADSQLPVLTSPKGNLGNPVGQAEATSTTPSVAMRANERAGIGNFNFGLPIASLPGRGSDASIGLSYNSQLWTKSSDGGNGYLYTYNVDGNWLAPGFQLTYGYLDKYGSKFILTGNDGTRTQLNPATNPDPTSTDTYYQADDGSFTGAYYSTSGVKILYTDGTRVQYGLPNGQQRRFPTRITDRHGNYISISYLASDNAGKISDITDTLGRHILFHYDTNSDKLLAVTVPGYDGSATRRQTIRFYYENLTLTTTSRFNGIIDDPGTVSVLKYVYYPGTNTGYKYDYSSYYGMIYKITRLEGMSVTGGSDTTQMGSVNSGYLESASTRYNYPGTDIAPPASTLNDVPKYDSRTDDWQGRTGSAPVTYFAAPVETLSGGGGTRTTQITSADGTTSTSVAIVNPGQWDDGLTKENSLTTVGRSLPWAKTTLTWEQGQGTVGRRNPRVHKIETTNEAGQTKATIFGYDYYNNQTQVKELDFAAAGQEGVLLRQTDVSYVTDTNYTYYNRLVRLPLSVKKTVNNTVVSRTDYEYDQSTLTNRSDAVQYDVAFNPNNNQSYSCNGHWVCDAYIEGDSGRCQTGALHYDYDICYTYDAHRNARGNVTKITSFVNTSATESNPDPNASVTTFKYDITGNTVEASLNCCNVKTWTYNATNQYAYPISETKGSDVQLTTYTEYDFYTGLVKKTKDENIQETSYEYEPDTLRIKKVTYPNGGYTQTEYSDKLINTSSQLVPGFVLTTTKLDATHTAQSYHYYDARGFSIRTATATAINGWSISSREYDNIGRIKRRYNPFYTAAANDAAPSGTKYMEVANYDGLGRATQVQLQDTTTVSTDYYGTVVTVTDQAGKQKRQVTDALGRLRRVDEPDLNGSLGIVTDPTQPTTYDYDGNDNLTKVIQSDGTTTQERKFKYDALSRLTNEKQVEANATLNDIGEKGTIDSNKWTKVLRYDTHNLVTDGWDARGVNTHFSYDGLNRVKKVEFSDGTPTVKYTYDQARTGFYNNGALTRVETELVSSTPADTPTTTTEFDFDKMGRAVKHRQSIGTQAYNLEYGYNLAGQLTSETYPSGKIINYGYDTNGRLSNIADQSRTYLSGIQYLGSGNNVNGLTLGNSTVQGFEYNNRLQLTKQTLTKTNEILQQYDYSYGQMNPNTEEITTNSNNGQLGKVESYIGGQKQWTQKFFYDSLGRLSDAKEYKGSTTTLSYKQHFDFDRFGNLYRKQANNSATGQETPLPYTAIENSDISKSTNQFTTSTTYDDAGNVTTDNKFRAMSFAYDANGRMIKATKANTPDALSVYDAAGQRVAEKVNDVWRFLVFDIGGKIVAEYGGLSATDEGGVKYVFTDWQGSTRAMTTQGGFVKARQDYTAFGEEINTGVGLRTAMQGFGSPNNLRQKYGLAERDEATGLDHTWFRKNENRSGRWTSPDPYISSMNLGNPQSFNRYTYVNNQPVNFIDPSGLHTEVYCSWIVEEDGSWSNYSCETVEVEDNPLLPLGGNGTVPEPRLGGAGSLYDTITPKKGQDTHIGRCKALERAIKGHIYQAERHLKNYGDDFNNWVSSYPPFNYLTGQLNDYQKHVNAIENLTEEYNKYCNDQGPPPPSPVFQNVPSDIQKKSNQTYFQRLWDAIPAFPTDKQIEKMYPGFKGAPIFPTWSPAYN